MQWTRSRRCLNDDGAGDSLCRLVRQVHVPVYFVQIGQMAIGRFAATAILNLYAMRQIALDLNRRPLQSVDLIGRQTGQGAPVDRNISRRIGNIGTVLVAIERLRLGVAGVACRTADGLPIDNQWLRNSFDGGCLQLSDQSGGSRAWRWARAGRGPWTRRGPWPWRWPRG